MIDFYPTSFIRKITWSDPDTGEDLWLLAPEELERVPSGTVLTSISGRKAIVGVDYVDTDTRGGFLAFGVFEYQIETVDSV